MDKTMALIVSAMVLLVSAVVVLFLAEPSLGDFNDGSNTLKDKGCDFQCERLDNGEITEEQLSQACLDSSGNPVC